MFFILIGMALIKYDLLTILNQTSLSDICILILFGLLVAGILSAQLLVSLGIFTVKLTLFTSWALSSMNSLINYVLPAKTGTVFKGIILKNKYGLSYSNYISLLFVINLLVVLSGLFLFLIFAIIYNHISIVGSLLIASITILAIIILYLFETNKLKINLPIRIEYITKINDGIRICLKNKGKILIILSLNYIVIILSAVRLYWCFTSLGVNIKLHQVLYIQLLTSLSFLFSITPANLFVKEGIIIAVGNAFAINGELVIATALMDRATSIASIIIAVIISLPKYKTELKLSYRNPH